MAHEENKFSGALNRNHFGFWKVSHLSSQHSFTDSQGLPHCCFWLQQHTLYWPKTCLAGIQTCPLLKPLTSHRSEKYHKGGLKLLRRWYLQARCENILLSKRNGLQSPSNPYRELIKEILILCGKFHNMLKTSKANRKCNFFSYLCSIFS